MYPYINIHTHSFSSNPEELSIYNLDLRSHQPINTLANCHISTLPHQHIKQSAGIHPWFVDTIDISQNLNILENLIREQQICAVGEIGLDKACKSDFKHQKAILRLQLSIASQNKLPVIIHCVKAYNEVVEILVEQKHTTPVIFHGFNSSMEMALQLINKGYYLSFGPEILNNKSKRRTIIKNMPINQLFLETDDRDISINSVYEEAAILIDMNLDMLKEMMFSNFENIFQSNDVYKISLY